MPCLKQYISIVFLAFAFWSCDSIKREDLTVIDGIRLGVTEKTFIQELDSLKTPKGTFFIKTIFDDLFPEKDRIVNSYFSETFNLDKYGSRSYVNHFGILQPIKAITTDNVIGVNVLLISTDVGFSDYSSKDIFARIGEPDKIELHQSITSQLVSDIESLLISKYGTPYETERSKGTSMFLIMGSQIKEVKCDSTDTGDLLKWKTKYLDIGFFKGSVSRTTKFDSSSKKYFRFKEPNLSPWPDWVSCNSYSYLYYSINKETIRKLQLDKTKL